MYVSKLMTFPNPHIGHSRHGLFLQDWIVSPMLNLLTPPLLFLYRRPQIQSIFLNLLSFSDFKDYCPFLKTIAPKIWLRIVWRPSSEEKKSSINHFFHCAKNQFISSWRVFLLVIQKMDGLFFMWNPTLMKHLIFLKNMR
jgi:hypothetical protein